jgi:succinate-acetate transporter protein
MAVSASQKTDSILANPAPLGLMAFGVTTVLLNIANAGYYPLNSIILAMGIFYGGLAQVVAGAMEFKKGNTFGMTAFLSYGFFWLSFVFLILLQTMGLATFNSTGLAYYLFMWGLFTSLMFIGTLRLNGALMVVFGTLAILFFLLAAGASSGNSSVTNAAGYEGIICGLSAMYASIATLLNEVYKRQVLPLFTVGQKS